jgi:hypothetical protein
MRYQPLLPLESIIAKTTDVPASNAAGQSYVEGPVGGLNWNDVPPGINPYNTDKFTDGLYVCEELRTDGDSDRLDRLVVAAEYIAPVGTR